jgi:hypothetical protein
MYFNRSQIFHSYILPSSPGPKSKSSLLLSSAGFMIGLRSEDGDSSSEMLGSFQTSPHSNPTLDSFQMSLPSNPMLGSFQTSHHFNPDDCNLNSKISFKIYISPLPKEARLTVTHKHFKWSGQKVRMV